MGDGEVPYKPGYELVAEKILAKIAADKLVPGDRLPTEREIAEELGVSRAVTREAVKILAALNRVTVRKGAGICVAAPTEPAGASMLSQFQPTNLEQVQMLFAYRRLIESESASRAAMRANPQQVRELVALAAASADAAARDDEPAFATLDADFHVALAAGAGNLFIEASVSMVRSYSGQVGRLLFRGQKPGSLVVAGAQHQDIAAGVAAGDPAAAAKALVLHIDTTEAQFERRLLERLSYVDDAGSPSHG
jgi:GntR family transcriptional repressor for pyruvate dehydrogenase complex